MRPGTMDQDSSAFLTLSMVPSREGTHNIASKDGLENFKTFPPELSIDS